MLEKIRADNVNPVINAKVYESVERMLVCLLGKDEKNCKHCKDCNACSFLTQAVFTIGCK